MKTVTPGDIVVRVPRYGTVAPPPEVVETARRLVAQSGGVFKPNEIIDPHSTEGESVDNASEWNSMLITARAKRGPHWDVSSQLFQVDKESHLYYDHSPLVVGEATEQEALEPAMQSQGATPSGSAYASPPPGFRRTPSQAISQSDYLLQNGTHLNTPATPSPAPMRPDLNSGRRITRGTAGRDNMY